MKKKLYVYYNKKGRYITSRIPWREEPSEEVKSQLSFLDKYLPIEGDNWSYTGSDTAERWEKEKKYTIT